MWLSAVMNKWDSAKGDMAAVSDRNLAMKIAAGLNKELR
jgi:hypothetical protein